MLRYSVVICTIGISSLIFASALAQPNAAASDDCKTRFALAPFDQSMLQLLGPAVVPANPGAFVNPAFQQLRDWNFPPKVAAWRDRPSVEELAHEREELTAPPPTATEKSKKAATPQGTLRSYDLLTMSSKEFGDLQKWFAKEAPKRVPGACVDQEKTDYVVAVGMISDGSGDDSMATGSARNEYGQSASARPSNVGVGPNAATYSPGYHNADAGELSSIAPGGVSRPGVYTCAYFFRSIGGARRETPDYYYCRSGESLPRAAVTTLLKYLAGTSLP